MNLAPLAFDFEYATFNTTLILAADSLTWLPLVPENTFHAVVTDPPYGVKEYETEQIRKRDAGHGGVWRIPPTFDGSARQPLPRFTALNARERAQLQDFFTAWATQVARVLRPGGHVMLASNAFLSQPVFAALIEGGLEFRGEIIRLVRTFRGGDRPKNAEAEFDEVCSLPRSGYEPWGLFRKPLPRGMTVGECLKQFGTGGLRRVSPTQPFSDVIESERTPQRERQLADHPSLKPQSLMRQLVRAALPLGTGVILDPFMGSGSTVAAAEALGLQCVGVERHTPYFEMSRTAVPQLAALALEAKAQPTLFDLS